MSSDEPKLKIKLQIYRGDDIAMGPGKAALLESIMREGSISAAGRALGMSYRRCWMLVEVMNRCWREPLVETSAGGRSGGGASLTNMGRHVLALYRGLQSELNTANNQPQWRALQQELRAD
ncbi:MAG: LysR family transcriptional regulator [Sphingobium sp.]